ncbi:hypothetical protein QFZ42_004014 [Variovorax paradoxus]|uniref:hypothetical protein n=1 Tax=Variovorax paradoxus TaxID=34073 RepID=UPI002794AF59|nr:hypothetical protein [Variovorax paradoxus]MDQ0572180.1 hypothetical protein [Variovorax paradoxus]
MLAVKVSGYDSLQSLIDWAGSYMVDLGYVSHEGAGFALVSPDEDASVNSLEDFVWFRGVVASSLPPGLRSMTVHMDPVDPESEKGLRKLAD